MYRACIVCFVYLQFTRKSRDVHCLYVKNQRCSRGGFRFVKKNDFTESTVRKYEAEFAREENVGENKMAIVQYLLMHLSVGAVPS